MGDITYQNKDVASKVTSERLIGKSLAPFGLEHLHIVDILPTNLPAIESNELRLDNLFLLSDGSLAIIDYESEFSRENFVKYINYIGRVLKRYSLNKKLEEIREIRMIVIYTADIESAQEIYNLGGITLKIEAAYLVNMNSNHIYQKLRFKIENHEPLTEEELMELMILPLTAKGLEAKQEYIIKVVELARKLPNQNDVHTVIEGLLTFTDKFIESTYAEKLRREITMLTKVEQIMYREAYEEAYEKAYVKAYEKATIEITIAEKEKRIISAIQLCKDLGNDRFNVLKQLPDKFSITEKEANEYMQAIWK